MNLGQDSIGSSSQSSSLQCKLTALHQELKQKVFHGQFLNKEKNWGWRYGERAKFGAGSQSNKQMIVRLGNLFFSCKWQI